MSKQHAGLATVAGRRAEAICNKLQQGRLVDIVSGVGDLECWDISTPRRLGAGRNVSALSTRPAPSLILTPVQVAVGELADPGPVWIVQISLCSVPIRVFAGVHVSA